MCVLFGALSAVAFSVAVTATANGQASFPIAVGSAQGQESISAAFDGTNYLVGLQGDAVDRHNIAAQLVSQSGTLVGSLIPIGHTGGAPSVAFDGTRYLLAWTDDGTNPQNRVYGQFIAPAGNLEGAPFAIGPASGGQELNALAFGATTYLVVWDCRQDTGCTGIQGQLVAPSGALVGPVIALSETAPGAGTRKDARLAFGGSNFLVAWTESDSSTVVARLVSQTGMLLGPAFVVNASPAPSDNPGAVGFDGTNYLVLWNDEVGGMGSHGWELFGQLVTPAGVLTGPVLPIMAAPGAQIFPGIAFDGTTYLIGWNDFSNDTNHHLACDPGEGTCADAYGRFFTPSGAPVGALLGLLVAAGNQLGSALSFGAERYLVVFIDGFDVREGGEITGGDVYGTFRAARACLHGDCDASGDVTINELITMAEYRPRHRISTCTAGDANGGGEITINEIIGAVNKALNYVLRKGAEQWLT